MKILAIGDPHAKKNNSREIRLLGQKIKALCEEQKPDMAVILGDLANDFAKMHLAAWQEIIDFIDIVSSCAPKVYYIVGNHDAINNQIFLTKDHFFRVFDGRNGNVKVVDDLTVDGSLVFVPYVPPGRFMEALGEGCRRKGSVIFCHQEFREAKMGAIRSVHGDEWPLDAPLVISGHIHDRDRLQKNILYVGAPYQTSFGDNSKKSVELIEITEGKIKTTPIDLKMPKKITIKVSLEEFKELALNADDHYRIYVEGTSEEIHRMKKTEKYKEVKNLAKVIPKPTDKIIVKKGVVGKSFEEILHEALESESKEVNLEYQEVMKYASENQ